MNRKEFLEYLSQHLPSTLRKVTLEDLKRWEDFGVLCPRPEYYREDIRKVVGLVQMEEQSQKQALKQGIEPQKRPLTYSPSGTIYQVLSFLAEGTSEAEMKEKAILKLGLVNSGLISTLGFIYINFSPLTGNTLESLLAIPAYKSRFEKAAASKELLIIQDAIQFVESETEKEMLTTLTPVLFIQGIKPTVVYSTVIFGGKGRLLGPDEYVSLPRPLHEEFLDSNMRSFDDIVNFMAAHFMVGSFGVPHDKDEVDFIKTSQEKMRHILMKATKGSLGVADLSPLSPFHEDDVIEGSRLGKMGGIDIFSEKEKPISIGEIKVHPAFKMENHEWVPYDESKLPIRRYYNWLDFMWAELIDTVTSGSQTPVCLRCGKLLSRKRGRRKMYCGSENLAGC
jgi:hypothetical protein